MAFHTLFFVLGAERATDNVVEIASVCTSEQTHRVMQLIQVAPSLPIAIEMPLSDQWVLEMGATRKQAGETGRSLERTLKDAGVPAEVQVVVCERTEIESIAGLSARYADLGVVSQSLFSDQDVFNRTLIGLLFQSGKPVLVLPSSVALPSAVLTPKTVMIAWDEGLPASRTVGHSIDLLKRASNVHVVCVDPKAQETGYGEAPGWDLANYLSRHGVEVTVAELNSGGLSVDAVLRRHSLEIGAQLIVMGGYGHSRLRERLLGGTTRAMIEQSELPIVMAH